MTASTFGYSGLIRFLGCFVFMAISAGCTGTGEIKPNQTAIDQDSSVIAFSVNTTTLLKNEIPIRAVRLSIQYGTEFVSIRLHGGKTGVQRILLEVPAQSAWFSQLELTAGGGFFPEHYLTGGGQPVELAPGEITYLGRIEIEDMKFEENTDGSIGEPTAVKVVFADALEDDQPAWEQDYDLFQNRVPIQQIAESWAVQDYATVWIKAWTSIYANSLRGRWSNSGHPPGTRPNSSNSSPPGGLSGSPGQQPH